MNIFIEKSKNYDPYENLAMEQALFEFVQREYALCNDVYGLFLWQNEPSIIFGRNQNIKAECNYEKAIEAGIKLVRRNSGGGAVYHDLGNLNFTLICKDSDDAIANNNQIIIKALSNLGVEAVASGRNDLLAEGCKFSGNAYTRHGGILVHHGTLMVNLDIGLAEKLLTPAESKLARKGISSVKSRIINLSSINKSITVENLKREIENVFITTHKDDEAIAASLDFTGFQAELARLKSAQWIDCDGIKCATSVSGDYGIFKFTIEEKDSKIKKIHYESDILEVELLEYMLKYLQGVSLEEEALLEAYDDAICKWSGELTSANKQMLNSIMTSIINSLS